jgi:hypothetical protein
MDKAVVAPNLFAIHIQQRIETLHLTGYTRFLVAGIEDGDRAAARLSLA